MPRKSFSTGPTGTNRIGPDAQHLVRYWRAELGCSEDELRDAIAVVGLHHERGESSYVAKQMGNSPEMVFGVYAKWIKGADKGRERDKVNAALRGFGTDSAPESAKTD